MRTGSVTIERDRKRVDSNYRHAVLISSWEMLHSMAGFRTRAGLTYLRAQNTTGTPTNSPLSAALATFSGTIFASLN